MSNRLNLWKKNILGMKLLKMIKFYKAIFFESCDLVIPIVNPEIDELNYTIREYDVIVISQSCDLANNKLDIVQVCAVWSLNEFREQGFHDKNAKWKKKLERILQKGQ